MENNITQLSLFEVLQLDSKENINEWLMYHGKDPKSYCPIQFKEKTICPVIFEENKRNSDR
jgi:hypothetical protein